MAQTLTQIGTTVLQNIGRLPSGQTADPNQLKIVKDKYPGLYEELLNNALVNWSSTDNIPDFAEDTIVDLLSGRVSGIFGVPNIWTATEAQERELRKKLGNQISSPYVSQVTRFENF